MKKKQTLTSLFLQQNVLSILLLTFAVIGVWVGFSIYFSYSKTTIAPTDAALIAPLTPKLDGTLFDKLATRLAWSDQELSGFTPSVVVAQTPQPTPRPTQLPLVVPLASQSATQTSTSSGVQQ